MRSVLLKLCGVFISSWLTCPAIADNLDGLDRSPVDLVLAADDSWLATVNQTSDSVTLVQLPDGKMLHEISVGKHPVAIAANPVTEHLYVTCGHSGELVSLKVEGNRLKVFSRLHLGFQPQGVVVSADGRRAFVALTDADQVAEVDLESFTLSRLIEVGRWPRYLALSADGSRMAVGTSGDRGISIVDVRLGELVHVDRFVGLNIGHLQLSKDGSQVYFPWMVYRRNPITDRNIRIGWVLASRLGRIGFEEDAHREAISLDPPGRAVADPHGVALTADERQVVITASGTHELLVLQVPGLPFESQGSTDHLDQQLQVDSNRFFRIELGGRPMGVRVSQREKVAYVANYLQNSVQVVNLVNRQVTKQIDLGGSQQPSLARRGEAIFYDASRSLDQWYSCHSCHFEGGTNAVVMDTQNDGSAFTFKTVLPLYHFDQTGPWTWHGWQKDPLDSLQHSLKTTMLGPEPSQEDVLALFAYLNTLSPPRNPWLQQIKSGSTDASHVESVRRGEQIFHGPLGACSSCHSGNHYSDGEIHDLKLGQPEDRYQGFNTPTLTGVLRKVLLLHDGQASSLELLLRGPHAPEKVLGKPLNDSELRDLIEYLKTL